MTESYISKEDKEKIMRNEKRLKIIYNIGEIFIVSMMLYFGYEAHQEEQFVSESIWLMGAFLYMMLSSIWFKLYEIHRDQNKISLTINLEEVKEKAKEKQDENEEK